jgi:purine-binding chemotaxis protein CheW
MSGGKRIDWAAVRQRMAAAEALIGRSLEPDPARIAELLRQRAARLAERRTSAAAAPTVRVLSFWLGEELCALEITAVAEVLPYQRCTPVPGQAAELLGVVNLRGRIRPVLDLAAFTGAKGAGASGGYILFLRTDSGELGARVDRVDAVRNIRLDELTDAGRGSGQLASRFAKGITGDSLILLDTEAVQATLANVVAPAS